MKNSEEIWAIIPTRGGSTGLPEKNIRVIAGRPLLHYMLETAKGSLPKFTPELGHSHF